MFNKIELWKFEYGTTFNPIDITDEVDIGVSIIKKLDESLDIGTLTINDTDISEPFNMFDIIVFYIDDIEKFSFRIASDSVVSTTKDNTLFSHTITLVEHTKLLERYFITGKTFTQPKNGTRYTLYDVVNILRLTNPLELNLRIDENRPYVIPNETIGLLLNIRSPEFTFKDITLREALDSVLNYIDGISRIEFNTTTRENELHIDFFDEIKEQITYKTDAFSESKSQNIDLYATDANVDINNLVNENSLREAVEVYPSEKQFITSRSTEFIWDFTTAFVPTPKPIYRISKLLVKCDITIKDGGGVTLYNGEAEIDIADRVRELQDYKTLEITEASQTNFLSRENFYKGSTVYYEYAKNNIFIGNTFGLFGVTSSLQNAIEINMREWAFNNGYISSTQYNRDGLLVTTDGFEFNLNATLSDIDDLLYSVSYLPISSNVRLNIDKIDLIDVYKRSTLNFNQRNRIVDLENFTNNTQGKINRIGNKDLELSNIVTNINDAYIIGDYTEDDFIITSIEYIFFEDYIECNYLLSRNFNRVGQFIGINSEIRQWEIGEGSRTLQRNINFKEYVACKAFTAIPTNDTVVDNTEIITQDGKERFLDTFEPSVTPLKPINNGAYNKFNDVQLLHTSVSSNGGGNSLIYNFQFVDNKNIGNKIDDTTAQKINQFIAYTEDDGTFDKATIQLFDDFITPASSASELVLAKELPLIDSGDIDNILYILGDLVIYKDSREILAVTIQHSLFALDSKQIIIGRSLLKRNNLITEEPPQDLKLYIYNDSSKKFGFRDNLNPLEDADFIEEYNIGEFSIATFTADNTIRVSSTNLTSSTSSWCLTDENDNVVIAVNQDGTLTNFLKFYFLRDRIGLINI